jgi:hypothetical protein
MDEIVICIGDDRYPTGSYMTGPSGPLTEDDALNVVRVVADWAESMGVDHYDLRQVL